jgi:hypothetical protein
VSSFKFSAFLQFRTPHGDLQDVCDSLGMVPSPRWIVGRPRKALNGAPLAGVYDISYCNFKLHPRPDEGPNELLQRVADQVSICKDLLDGIRSEGGNISFYVSWRVDQNRGETFSESLLRKLGSLRIDLGVEPF